jgi:hypothetical protein
VFLLLFYDSKLQAACQLKYRLAPKKFGKNTLKSRLIAGKVLSQGLNLLTLIGGDKKRHGQCEHCGAVNFHWSGVGIEHSVSLCLCYSFMIANDGQGVNQKAKNSEKSLPFVFNNLANR